MDSLVAFLFIVAIPVAAVAGGLVTLFAIGALFDALDHPEDLQGRVNALFHQPPRDPRPLSTSHYYQPYWR
jgi:hypothetical protein